MKVILNKLKNYITIFFKNNFIKKRKIILKKITWFRFFNQNVSSKVFKKVLDIDNKGKSKI